MSTGYERMNTSDPVQANDLESPSHSIRGHHSTSRVQIETVTADDPPCFRHRVGIDANQPIHPRTGQIRPQVADPDVIASTGTGWVRLNFIRKPWSGPADDTLYDGRTWAEAYGQIISGFREKGLRIYGLIGVEAVRGGPADSMRLRPPHGEVENEWLKGYVEGFVTIMEMFHSDVQIFESFNEPDDWHGEERNWVHPGWFAIMLQRIYTEMRSRPALDGLKLVSGPLQGFESNRNAAVHYLRNTYREGKAWFGWGREGVPFPFDGVGYHLYVKPGYTPDRALQAREVRTTCSRYLNAMHQVIRQEEGRDKRLYVSEVGWNSLVDPREVQRREEFQAHALQVGLDTVYRDPLVGLVFWFCTQDFSIAAGDRFYGLYRPGEPTLIARKPAFDAFQAFCERTDEGEPPQCTNQQVINAFYYAAVDLGLTSRWSLMARAGLSLSELAADRGGIYTDTPISQLQNLTAAEKTAVQARLDEQLLRASISLAAGDIATERLGSDDAWDDDLRLDLLLGMQERVLKELRRNNELLALVLEQLTSSCNTGAGFDQILPKVHE